MLKTFEEKKWLKTFIKVFLLIAFCIFSYARARKENELGDFHVFWFAGKSIINNWDIYFVTPGWRAFIYPPFAALFFIPLAILPFKIACFIFFLLNMTLFFFTANIVKKMLVKYIPDSKIVNIAYWGAVLLVFKISWNNLMMVQVNQIVYMFVVLGIYYFINQKENWSIFHFCIAISLKIFPILFAFWVIVRGSKTAFFKFALGGLICILLPFIFTGPSKGLEQLEWYYKHFVVSNVEGAELGSGYASQSLPSLLHRTLLPSEITTEPSYTIVDLGKDNVKNIIKFSQLSLFGLMLLVLIYSRVKKLPINIVEPAIVITTIHLISSCTWKAHMVGMIVVFAVVVAELYHNYLNKRVGVLSYLLAGYLVVVSLLGQVFIGKKLQMYFGAYGDYTWQMFFCLIYLYYLFVKKNETLLIKETV